MIPFIYKKEIFYLNCEEYTQTVVKIFFFANYLCEVLVDPKDLSIRIYTIKNDGSQWENIYYDCFHGSDYIVDALDKAFRVLKRIISKSLGSKKNK